LKGIQVLNGQKAELTIGKITHEVVIECGNVQPNDGGLLHEPELPPMHYAILARLSAPIEDIEAATLVLADGSTFEVKVKGGRYLLGERQA
jgi:hypothetical protein